jgi:uncharacterized membrane protein (DUF106 family)
VKNPIRVWRTDLATPTSDAVRAELTAAQRNCEKVRMQPDNTRMMNVAMKPVSVDFLFIRVLTFIYLKCFRVFALQNVLHMIEKLRKECS